MPVAKLTGLDLRDDAETALLAKVNELADAVNNGGGIGGNFQKLAISETLTVAGVTPVTLGAGPIDLDRSSQCGIIAVTPAAAGTIIRSVKSVQSNNYGERLIIRNMGSSVNPKDYLIMLSQDDPAGTFSHFHLGGRQPWAVIPPLEAREFELWDIDGKWHPLHPTDLSLTPRPIDITTAVLSSGNLNDFAPTDGTTGMSHKFASWVKCQCVSGTRVTGFDTTGTAGSQASRRVLLTNFSNNAATLANLNSGGGTSTVAFKCPNNADFTWRAWASVWIDLDLASNLWFVEGV